MPSPAAVSSSVRTGCLLLCSSWGFQGREGESRAGGRAASSCKSPLQRLCFQLVPKQQTKPGLFCGGGRRGCAEPSGTEQRQRSALAAWRGRSHQQSHPGPRDICAYPSPLSPEGLTGKVCWGLWFGTGVPGWLLVLPSIAAAAAGAFVWFGCSQGAWKVCLGGLIVQQSSGFASFCLVGGSMFTNTDLQSPFLSPPSCHLLDRERLCWGKIPS